MKAASLLFKKRFAPIFWTQFMGAFNDNFLKNALVILFLYRGIVVAGIAPDVLPGIASGLLILPFFLFSAFAGQIADKYEKSHLIRWIKIWEIILMACSGLALIWGYYQACLVLLFLMGLQSTFFGPIKYSILPQILPEEELVAGNALVEMGTNLAILLGTITGGVIIGLPEVGEQYTAIGLFVIAILGWVASLFIPSSPPSDPSLKIEWEPLRPTWRMIGYARETRSVFLSILGISWFWLFGVILLALLPPYAKNVFLGEESIVTLFLVLFCIGVGVGSILCEKLSFDRLELGLVPLGSLGMTIFALDLFFVGEPEALKSALIISGQHTDLKTFFAFFDNCRVAFDLFMIAFSGGVFIVPLYTLVQERSDPQKRSRVIAANNIINALFMVAGAGATALFFSLKLTIPQVFFVIAIVNAAVACYIYALIPEFTLRLLAYFFSRILYRIKDSGWDKIPKEGACVLTCNHVTFIDWLIIAGVIKRPARFVMDHTFMNMPFFSIFFKQAKVIPIASAKENPKLLDEAFDKIAAELQAGEIVCIFPEGKLTPDGTIQPFRPGIEKIIARTPVPVYPMTLRGLWGSFFSRKYGKAMTRPFKRFWSRIEMEIGDPIPPQNLTASGLQEIISRMRGAE